MEVWRAAFPMKIVMTVTCCVCEVTEQCSEQSLALRQQMYNPQAPEGWKMIHGQLVCPKHSVEIEIDGNKTAYYGEYIP